MLGGDYLMIKRCQGFDAMYFCKPLSFLVWLVSLSMISSESVPQTGHYVSAGDPKSRQIIKSASVMERAESS